MRLAMLCVAGLALGLQAVLAEIPVSFDHGKRFWLCVNKQGRYMRRVTNLKDLM